MAKCVQCGFCCTQAPCPYGTWDKARRCCTFLTADMKCGKYDEIMKDPGALYCPAFGAGCTSSLFNDMREQKLKELRQCGTTTSA